MMLTLILSRHVKDHVESVHENIKNYYCDLCSYANYYDYKLKRHYKVKHNEELSSDLTKYTLEALKKKIYYTLPRPKRGKWIVVLERI